MDILIQYFHVKFLNAQYCMDIDKVTIEYFVKVKQMKIVRKKTLLQVDIHYNDHCIIKLKQ
jgi:hypothetical protein